MAIISYSVHHQRHGLAAVAACSKPAGALPRYLRENFKAIRGVLLLSTCNRVDLFLETTDQADTRQIDQVICEKLFPKQGTRASLPIQVRRGKAVLEHLFTVASGLDSMVVGEREISGQLRRALKVAQDQQVIGGNLTRICEQALSTSRKVAHLTGLASQGRSVVAAALDIAEQKVGSLAQQKAVLIGTGSYAGASVAALRVRNIADISVYSSSGRAHLFASGHDLTALDDHTLPQALAQAKVVISCRGLGSPVLGKETVLEALRVSSSTISCSKSAVSSAPKCEPQKEGDHQAKQVVDSLRNQSAVIPPEGAQQKVTPQLNDPHLLILDLALQSDIEDSVLEIPQVEVINLPHIQRQLPDTDFKQLQRAKEIIKSAVEDAFSELKARSMDGIVVALRNSYHRVLAEEIDRLPTDRAMTHQEVAYALKHLAARLAHTPTRNARLAGQNGKAKDYVAALHSVMGIETDFDHNTCPITGLRMENLGEEIPREWNKEAL